MILFIRTFSGILLNQVETCYLYIIVGFGGAWVFFGGALRWCSSDCQISPTISSTKMIRSKIYSAKYQLHRDQMHKNHLLKNCLTILSTYQKGVAINQPVFDSFTCKSLHGVTIIFSYLRTSSACQAASSSSSQALVFSCQVSKSPSSG